MKVLEKPFGSYCRHKQAWSKDLIKPSAWRSHAIDEDPLEHYVSSVLNMKIMC